MSKHIITVGSGSGVTGIQGVTGLQGYTGLQGSIGIGISEWGASNAYQIGDRVSYKGLVLRCLSNHTSSSAISTDLANWAASDPSVLMITQAGQYSRFTPVYYNGSSWEKARADVSGTLATHAVLESSSTTMLLVDSGTYTYTHGLSSGIWYCSTSLAGAVSDTAPINGYVNPVLDALNSTTIRVVVNQPAEVATDGGFVAADGFTLLGSANHTNAGSGQDYTISFTGGVYQFIRFNFIGKCATSGQQTVYLRPNNDSGSNYTMNQLYGNSTTPTSSNNTAFTGVPVAIMYGSSGLTAGAYTTGSGSIDLSFPRRFQVQGDLATAATTWVVRWAEVSWSDTSNQVTSLVVSFPTGVTGKFVVFGRGF